jgi:hypothetical protein
VTPGFTSPASIPSVFETIKALSRMSSISSFDLSVSIDKNYASKILNKSVFLLVL